MTRLQIPQESLDLLEEQGLVYVPKEDTIYRKDDTAKPRRFMFQYEADTATIKTAFNTAKSSHDFPALLRNHTSQADGLLVIETLVQQLANVNGPLDLMLYSGSTDRSFLAQNGYDQVHPRQSTWLKTFHDQ